jgi:hypothetical protein
VQDVRVVRQDRLGVADPTIMICIHARTHESGLCFVVEHLTHLTGFCESCSVQNLFDPTKVLGSIGPSNHVKWLLERRRAPVGHLPVALAAMSRSQQAGSLSGSRRGPCCRGGTEL